MCRSLIDRRRVISSRFMANNAIGSIKTRIRLRYTKCVFQIITPNKKFFNMGKPN